MPGKVPAQPKIYHIVHIDRLPSILQEGYLLSDTEVRKRGIGGTTIGSLEMKNARQRKRLTTYTDLTVGDCVPFNLCPRSVLLYVNALAASGRYEGPAPPANQDGQDRILHIVANMLTVVRHADANNVRWVFTHMNAANALSQDFADLSHLHQLDWYTIESNWWKDKMDLKAAEFLVEARFPTHLIERIGVKSDRMKLDVESILKQHDLNAPVVVAKEWYYDD